MYDRHKYVKDNKIELKKTIKNKNIDLDLDRLIEWDKKLISKKIRKGNSKGIYSVVKLRIYRKWEKISLLKE